jgi:hypothetical protein
MANGEDGIALKNGIGIGQKQVWKGKTGGRRVDLKKSDVYSWVDVDKMGFQRLAIREDYGDSTERLSMSVGGNQSAVIYEKAGAGNFECTENDDRGFNIGNYFFLRQFCPVP